MELERIMPQSSDDETWFVVVAAARIWGVTVRRFSIPGKRRAMPWPSALVAICIVQRVSQLDPLSLLLFHCILVGPTITATIATRTVQNTSFT
jgi:hypothetical protein